MTVLSKWQREYRRLTDFVSGNPEVVISNDLISIPSDVRTEFYHLFDTVRVAFLKERFPNLLNEAGVLSGSYINAELDVASSLPGINVTALPFQLNMFLHNPTEGLIRVLHEPLFDLLKGKMDIEVFSQEVSSDILATFEKLYQTGYGRWIVLSLVKILRSDIILEVNIPSLINMSPREEDKKEIEVPIPRQTKQLSFYHENASVLTVPDFIVHSDEVNGYIAFRSEFSLAPWKASNISEHRDWYSNHFLADLEPRLILIYVADKPEEISLVADSEVICRPDLVIEFREQRSWYKKEEVDKIKSNHNDLKPKLGTYILSRASILEPILEELVDGIRLLTIGFDQFKIVSIIDAFMRF